jgi:hypothetical protein
MRAPDEDFHDDWLPTRHGVVAYSLLERIAILMFEAGFDEKEATRRANEEAQRIGAGSYVPR